MVINICRATIAALMAQPLHIISSYGSDGQVVYVTYRRPDDGSIWKNKCKFEGSRVIWAATDGRWRDIPGAHEYVTYELSPDDKTLRIRQRFSDASSIDKEFAFDQIE